LQCQQHQALQLAVVLGRIGAVTSQIVLLLLLLLQHVSH
jgi:hypothetical protein